MLTDLRKINATTEENFMWLCYAVHEPFIRWRNKQTHEHYALL